MDTLATIVVHYNTPQETVTCLTSLLKAKSKSFNHVIIIIDNGSKEPLVLPSKLDKDNVVLLRSEANLGFAGGNNIGIKHAIKKFDAQYVTLLNSDARIKSNALDILVAQAKENPEAGVLNPKIYFTEGMEFHKNSYSKDQLGNILWFAGGTIDWKDVASFHRGVDEVDRGQFDAVQETNFATGCCMFIKREVLDSVGLLSEELFLYWEDVEYSLRVTQNGYKLLYVPKAVAWHDNAGSSDGAGNQVSVYYQTRNRLYLAMIHGGTVAKKAAVRLAVKYLQGSTTEQKAVIDSITKQMGKQPII